MHRPIIVAAIGVLFAGGSAAQAYQPQTTTLERSAYPGAGNHTLLVRTDIGRGREVAWHTHPGIEIGYVEKGLALVRIEGRPDRRIGRGGSFDIPARALHDVWNVGRDALTIICIYVVDPAEPINKPLARR